MKKIIWTYSSYCNHCRTENDVILMQMNMTVKWTKKRVDDSRDMKESKKYRCVCTCCHANDLPWYNCVIFLRTITWTFLLLPMHYQKDREKIRQKEFICKPCHKELKDVKYSKNVQNCPHSDMFGYNVNHETR